MSEEREVTNTRWEYDAQADALYIYVNEGQPIAGQIEMGDGTIIDVTDDDTLIGIEVLSPCSPWNPDLIIDRFHLDRVTGEFLKVLEQIPWGNQP